MQHFEFVNWWIGEFSVLFLDVTNRLSDEFFRIWGKFLFMLWFHEHLVYEYSNPSKLNNPYYTIRKNISDRVHKPCVFCNKNHFSAVFHRPDTYIVLHQNGSKCVVLGQKLRKNLFHIGCKEKFDVDWGLHDAVWCALLKNDEKYHYKPRIL